MAVAFVVEDGSALATATSYLSVEDMKQLWDNAGYSHSALETSAIKILLNNATISLDGRYSGRWPGQRRSTSQALDWPRWNVVDQDGLERSSTSVPPEVERATAEMAYAVNTGVDVDPNVENESILKAEKVKVEGAVEEAKEYFEHTQSTYPTLPKVEGALRRLLGAAGKYGATAFRRV